MINYEKNFLPKTLLILGIIFLVIFSFFGASAQEEVKEVKEESATSSPVQLTK
jgi:preprotein translocase subunit SecG